MSLLRGISKINFYKFDDKGNFLISNVAKYYYKHFNLNYFNFGKEGSA